MTGTEMMHPNNNDADRSSAAADDSSGIVMAEELVLADVDGAILAQITGDADLREYYKNLLEK